MLRKLTLAVALAAAGVAAKADYLYWQVNASDLGSEVGTWDTAALNVYTKSGNAYSQTYFGLDMVDKNSEGGIYLVSSDLGNYTSDQYYFAVELYNVAGSSTDPVHSGWKWNYTELVSNGYVGADALSTSNLLKNGPLNGAATVPEPTSGVLLLIGGSLLALRRRRVAGASC